VPLGTQKLARSVRSAAAASSAKCSELLSRDVVVVCPSDTWNPPPDFRFPSENKGCFFWVRPASFRFDGTDEAAVMLEAAAGAFDITAWSKTREFKSVEVCCVQFGPHAWFTTAKTGVEFQLTSWFWGCSGNAAATAVGPRDTLPTPLPPRPNPAPPPPPAARWTTLKSAHRIVGKSFVLVCRAISSRPLRFATAREASSMPPSKGGVGGTTECCFSSCFRPSERSVVAGEASREADARLCWFSWSPIRSAFFFVTVPDKMPGSPSDYLSCAGFLSRDNDQTSVTILLP
jgi:hypothetical protein